jgi:hypothetical protein
MTHRRRLDSQDTATEKRRAAAETLAIAALGFIATDPERLSRFLAMTGINPDSIRSAARNPRFLAGVLEYLVADESLLLDFATANAIEPGEAVRAREALCGRWERDTP